MYKPRVLVIHNRYQQTGGEDLVVDAEIDLLRQAGHEVIEFIRDNAAIRDYSAVRKASLLLTSTWDRRTYRHLRQVIREQRPDIAHCHNLLPQISPAAYYACRDSGIPVVQTLHNYRMLCPAGTLFRNNQPCVSCVSALATGVLRGCYRGSRSESAAVAMMLGLHRQLGTWKNLIDAYIAVSHFSRDLIVAATQLPKEKVHVKSNFMACDPGPRTHRGNYALFVGRLSPEKGLLELLSTWRGLEHIPLRVVGGGPDYPAALAIARDAAMGRMVLSGLLSPAETLEEIRGARFLIFPSRWYEPFGMALLEAAACGVPAIASRIGGIPELVRDGVTGLLFDPEDPQDLTAKASWAWEHPDELSAMGLAARAMYLEHYTAEKNYARLMQVYDSVLSSNPNCNAGRKASSTSELVSLVN